MKKISQIETGGRFLYGGVEWVKLYAGDGTVAISAEPVFERAFDEDNKNDWRSSSLRRELNGAFLDALVAEGADRAAFLDWESDLTTEPPLTKSLCCRTSCIECSAALSRAWTRGAGT